jgi:adenine C2-methylase RlmN of 23S rRNA A2503 and tRNA A37
MQPFRAKQVLEWVYLKGIIDPAAMSNLSKLDRDKLAAVEVSAEAEAGWVAHCDELSTGSLFSQVESWIFGANIPGKKRTLVVYFGGVSQYRQEAAKLNTNDYPGFVMTKPVATA